MAVLQAESISVGELAKKTGHVVSDIKKSLKLLHAMCLIKHHIMQTAGGEKTCFVPAARENDGHFDGVYRLMRTGAYMEMLQVSVLKDCDQLTLDLCHVIFATGSVSVKTLVRVVPGIIGAEECLERVHLLIKRQVVVQVCKDDSADTHHMRIEALKAAMSNEDYMKSGAKRNKADTTAMTKIATAAQGLRKRRNEEFMLDFLFRRDRIKELTPFYRIDYDKLDVWMRDRDIVRCAEQFGALHAEVMKTCLQ